MMLALGSLLGTVFEPPSTTDFVWDPIVGPVKIFGISFSLNWIMILLIIAVSAFLLMFYVAFRKPKILPGKYQVAMEAGMEFVRQQLVIQMIGSEGLPYLAFLATLFFFIFLGNVLEIVPGVNFPLNSRLAFPAVMAVVAWFTYNTIGVARHGFFGYLKIVMFPPGAPWWLYILLAPIEFFTVVLVRPFTLTVRLTANMIAGHFLLSVFFLGTIVFLTGSPYVAAIVPFTMAVVMVGFELFVSALQAFIFAILTASYIAGAMAEEH